MWASETPFLPDLVAYYKQSKDSLTSLSFSRTYLDETATTTVWNIAFKTPQIKTSNQTSQQMASI